MTTFTGHPVSSEAAYDVPRIKLFAETVGLHGGSNEEKMTQQAYNLLADELTEILKKVILSAKSYSIHGRQSCLSIADTERACQDRSLQPTFGYALPRQKELRLISSNHGGDFYVREESDLEIGQILQQTHKIPAPLKLRCHWLVHAGVMEPIAENPYALKEDSTDEEEPNITSSRIAFRRDTAKILQENGAQSLYHFLAQNGTYQETVSIRPFPTAPLSVEKQMYLKSVLEASVGANDPLRVAALHSLETDTGLQEALPLIADIVKNGVVANVAHRCLSLLIYLVRVVRALALNRSLILEPSLHLLLPSLLTCCVGQSLCGRPDTDNHWALRDFAAKTLVIVVNTRSKSTAEVHGRVVRVLRQVFENNKSSYPMIYGTITPLCDLTSSKEKEELADRFHELVNECKLYCSTHKDSRDVRAMEAAKLLAILVKQMEPQMKAIRAMDEGLAESTYADEQ